MLGAGNNCGRVLSSPGTSGVRAAGTVRSLHQVHWQVKVGKIWLEPRASALPSAPFLAFGSLLLLLTSDHLGSSPLPRYKQGNPEHES